MPHAADSPHPSDSPDASAPDAVLTAVEARLISTFGEPDGRAAITFLGTDRIEVLRFPQAEGLYRYATLGMSASPMNDPTALVADPIAGPRVELVVTVRGGQDGLLRPLATLAAAPQVEGLVVAPGASLDLGEPLWEGAPFTSFLVAEPGGLVEDLELPEPAEAVRFLPLLPMTPNEAAHKRVHGAAELQERWLRHGTDLRDQQRRSVPLGDA
ncbi:suppressor of fused domain protein [Streptacidiphilus neutrinimicus]|uniref:suppressor of fused domain protein n=1 Tax=Streptacidiphilus neutrinimicus TaxID=105420 RepID=UPI000A045CBA|nr:suppressor of fused domain protein [Streptacidiphilus neutrinimicus]